MKRVLSVFLAILLIAVSLPTAYSASIFDGFVCEINENGTYTITGYRDFHTDYANIPAKINNIDVTAIGPGAFQSKSNLNTVRIPETVTAIGAMAFYGCPNLTTVIIGDNVKSIGAKAFNSCTSLTGVNLKNVEILGEYAFYGCTSLTELFCGNALKVIGQRAFHSCTSLNFIKWSPTLIYISDYVFSGCTAITALNFPDTLAYIGNSSFKGCSALASVAFGSGELEIAPYAFENCIALTQITIPSNVKTIGRCAFALREATSTEFSHSISITCSLYSGAIAYAKAHGLSVYIIETQQSVTLFGDADGNGIIDTNDAYLILRVAAAIEFTPDEAEFFLLDLNCNQVIDTGDAQLALKKAAGIV
ncbi:MAG: leucine-rich repeat protein [Clostridia bacterium]|nr:leucine-rich repeat protein [Clostridia bacterium]